MIELNDTQKQTLDRMITHGHKLFHIIPENDPEKLFLWSERANEAFEITANPTPFVKSLLCLRSIRQLNDTIFVDPENSSEEERNQINNLSREVFGSEPSDLTQSFHVRIYRPTDIGSILLWIDGKPNTYQLLKDIIEKKLAVIYPKKVKARGKFLKRRLQSFEEKLETGTFGGAIQDRKGGMEENLIDKKNLQRACRFGIVEEMNVTPTSFWSKTKVTVFRVVPEVEQIFNMEENLQKTNKFGIPNYVWQQMAELEKDYITKINENTINEDVVIPCLRTLMSSESISEPRRIRIQHNANTRLWERLFNNRQETRLESLYYERPSYISRYRNETNYSRRQENDTRDYFIRELNYS